MRGGLTLALGRASQALKYSLGRVVVDKGFAIGITSKFDEAFRSRKEKMEYFSSLTLVVVRVCLPVIRVLICLLNYALFYAGASILASFSADAQTLIVENPYKDVVNFQWVRGQTHAHSCRYMHPKDIECVQPRRLLELYRDKGYGYVGISDHKFIISNWPDSGVSCDASFQNPGVGGGRPMVYVPSIEMGGLAGFQKPWEGPGIPHIVYFGVHAIGSDPWCHPKKAQFPFDCKDKRDLDRYIEWINENGGVSIIAHPGVDFAENGCWKDDWIGHARAVEINRVEDRVFWDHALQVGNRIWGVANDDKSIESGIDSRGFVATPHQTNLPDIEEILQRLRKGAFYSVNWGEARNSDLYPTLMSALVISKEGSRIIQVAFKGARKGRVITATGEHAIDALEPYHNANQLRTMEYKVTIKDRYVRFELENDEGTIAYMQPFFVRAYSQPTPDPKCDELTCKGKCGGPGQEAHRECVNGRCECLPD